MLRAPLLPAFGEPQNLLLFQAGLRHRLNKLRVVVDVAVQPELGMEEEAPCEESPLLSSGVTPNKDPVTCNELLHLIPEGPPEVRRNISLTEAPNLPPEVSQLQNSSQPWGTAPFSAAETPGSPHTPSPALVLLSCQSSRG